MSTVRDMIRKKGSEVFSIPSDATVYEALTIMARHNTGALMVLSVNNKVDGILSERDCVRRVELEGRTAKSTKVSEIMTTKPRGIAPDRLAVEAVEMMEEHKVNQLLVLGTDSGLLGALNMHDLFRAKII